MAGTVSVVIGVAAMTLSCDLSYGEPTQTSSSPSDTKPADGRTVGTKAGEIIAALEAYRSGKDDEWLPLLVRLSRLGGDAIPAIEAALLGTDCDHLRRKLLIVLRSLDDVRAVPVIIRLMPRLVEETAAVQHRTLDDSDELSDDVLQWAIDHANGRESDGIVHYRYGSPVVEVISTLQQLLGSAKEVSELRYVTRSADATRDNAARQLWNDMAVEWAVWWNANSQDWTNDERYLRVEIEPFEPREGPKASDADVAAASVGRQSNILLSPLDASPRFANCFLDLDTGRRSGGRPRFEAKTVAHAAAWAIGEGFDLMVVRRDDDGSTQFALKPIAGQFWQINRDDALAMRRFLSRGEQLTLQESGELLLDYNAKTGRYGDDDQPAFLYETTDRNIGVILIDRDVTKVLPVDASGRLSRDVPGDLREYGTSVGVRFTHIKIGVPSAE